MIFTPGSKISLELVMQQLRKYKRCSGQSINSTKSYFLVNPKAEVEHISEIKIITGLRHIEFPTTYLRCPLYVGCKRICHFSDSVARIVRKTNEWQGKLLSIGGRAILIKHVLQSQPLHLLAAMVPPKTIFKQIEKYLARFYWGTTDGKQNYHWSSWANMCFSKEEGGIGLRRLTDVGLYFSMKR
ncbi:putative ribonuclease h protein [Nicotiana attenuata]|uniref:Ribonuclease h protein n=1 Tax=Nicotiana attenuata TaxID=49451 RepID=A0A1J6IRC1_NICAT|nr:putative ribonuclease h protein [Nicotiana attenuata]